MFGNDAVAPIIDIFNECADAGLKAYAPYTLDPRPNDLYNLETEPEMQYKIQKCYNLQEELEMVHLRLGAKNMNFWSCTCYWPEVGNAPGRAQTSPGPNLRRELFNSVLGSRSNRNSGGLEMLCNILGKAPHFGLMTDEGRKASG